MIGEILIILGLAIVIITVISGWIIFLIDSLAAEDYDLFAFIFGIGIFIVGLIILFIT